MKSNARPAPARSRSRQPPGAKQNRVTARQSAPRRPERDIYTGAWTTASEDYVDRLGQLTPKEEFEAAENHFTHNRYVQRLILTKVSFAMHGFNVAPAKGASAKAVEDWLKSEDRIAQLREYAETVWRDRYVFNNVVAMWVDGDTTVPLLLPPYRCEYSDPLGREMLRYEPGWKSFELTLLKDSGLADRVRRGGGKITLDPALGEQFKVLKWQRVGLGFGRPSLITETRALNQCESMEVGDSGLAFWCRTPVRHHLIGHEIRTGQFAGQPRHFMRRERAEAVKAELNGRTGPVEMATNFDHKIAFEYPEPNLFDTRKWLSIRDRLAWWAGSIGLIMAGAPLMSVSSLMRIFQQEVTQDRMRVEPFIEATLSATAPGPVVVRSSNQCFQDSRVWSELLKYGVQQGPISLQTFLEETGRDDTTEVERKKAETKQREVRMPLYSGAHGKVPMADGGRPTGVPDPPPQPS
jgi:hypothetical protein